MWHCGNTHADLQKLNFGCTHEFDSAFVFFILQWMLNFGNPFKFAYDDVWKEHLEEVSRRITLFGQYFTVTNSSENHQKAEHLANL